MQTSNLQEGETIELKREWTDRAGRPGRFREHAWRHPFAGAGLLLCRSHRALGHGDGAHPGAVPRAGLARARI